MTPSRTPHNRLQTVARRVLLAACTVLLLGVMGAAADQARLRPDRVVHDRPVITHTLSALLAAAHTDHARDAAPVTTMEPVVEIQAMHRIDPAPRTLLMEVTAYCPCTLCCGPNAQGITASGKHVSYNDGRFVAADTTVLPFGTRLIIPGYADDHPVEVIDRGGAIKGNKLDLYFDSHDDALQWGRQLVEVTLAD